ncbi:exodeoxyribonuclease III [Luteimicrobium subarcticum]|uniref:Exodeoxyribonuclease-3 n=1 Tax=Luteimicrobium subarcticum TaxID=620910 RepID=A0A2M8WV17_9MICO|nr:exodeoxyribonuclease III [Luteimicrobium subarcticum]PJI94775.1 exodeoxyribonuclease-3 [Luteimicrobium subarcticum]
MLTIATVNVNGIRAAVKRGMLDWVAERGPDVLLLQEVRATDEILDGFFPEGWHVAHQASDIKGRAGVAVLTRRPVTAVRVGLGHVHPEGVEEPPVDTGRWVEVDVELDAAPRTVTVVSTYIHSGTAGTPKMDEKYAYLEKVTARLAELAASGRDVVVGGDVNIAHREVDIKNWKGNLKAAGFLPEERAYLDRWFDDLGWVDLGRRFGGPGPGPYTWWSWRGQAFVNDAGWRIDYQLATPGLASLAKSVEVDRAETYEARFSDHAPVVVVYDV